MKNKEFKVGHVAEHEGKVGIITTNEINGIMSFKTLDKELYDITSDRVHRIPLFDELFVSMGFKIYSIPPTEIQNPILKMFYLVKLDNDIERMALYDHPFLRVHKGEIRYTENEKVEIYTVTYRHKNQKACSNTRIYTIDELQDFFEHKNLKLEFDNNMLWRIEKAFIQR